MNSKIRFKYPIGIQWKISEARLQEKRNSINGYIQSNGYFVPGTNDIYFVSIYPNGSKEEYHGRTRIVFHLNFKEKKEIESEISISIESANFNIKAKHVFNGATGGGFTPCTSDDLFNPEKRYIVDGFMVIKIEGFLMIEKEVPVELRKLSENGNTLGMDLWNQESKDFTIVADGKEIMAHKFVLATRSPVFAAMLKPHTQEAQENKVIIRDFSFAVVETAIKLCYDSRLVENIPLDVQMSILQFFDKYDISSLKIELEKLMILEVNEFTVCRFANCSLFSNAPKLMEKCSRFLDECFRQRNPVSHFDILDKHFASDLPKISLFKLSIQF